MRLYGGGRSVRALLVLTGGLSAALRTPAQRRLQPHDILLPLQRDGARSVPTRICLDP